MKQVCRIGRIKGDQRTRETGNIFITAEITEGKLSISGVIGPLRNGNAKGGCGQIDMEFTHRNPAQNDNQYHNLTRPQDIEFAPGWNAEKWLDLLGIWHEWHLNDMKPGCEHQRRDWDTSKELCIVTYRLTDEVLKEQNHIKAEAMKGLENVGQVKLTEHDQRILALPWEMKRPVESALSVDLVKVYNEKSRETKTAGWVYETDHPGGLLSKPCPVCGYKYGTSWLKVELPQDVIDFINALPETDIQPAWC